MSRLYLFLGLFTLVYFLQAIGSSYMITAVQNIERQFQIPSKLSGFLVSAHDISYIPTVIFVSYFGSRGNRAKWIGVGTILIALAHLFTASPNFFFPVKQPKVNITEIETRLHPNDLLTSSNASIVNFFNYAPIRDRISVKIRNLILKKLQATNNSTILTIEENLDTLFDQQNYTKNYYSLDEPLISTILFQMYSVLKDDADPNELIITLKKFVENRKNFVENDLSIVRRAAIAPFSFCYLLVNDLRQALKNIRCIENSSNFEPLLIIFIALLILGVGQTMPWTLGIPLIDDNVKSKSMPVYFAMISFIRIMGPICGFLIGSIVNKLYYTFPTKAPRGLTPQDPAWIGAWWLGFLIIGFITIFPSLALFFFPETSKKGKVTDSSKNLKQENNIVIKPLNNDKLKLSLFDRHVKKIDEKELPVLERMKKFLSSYSNILNSKVYMGSVIGRVMDVMAFKGYMVFLPKYLENHYGIPQYRVHLYMAVFGILGYACGTATGGFITRRFRMNGRAAAFFVFVISTLNTLIFFSKIFLGCHSIVNGIGRQGIETNFNYTIPCNSECGCSSARLFPVCDITGRSYYSPCHAGCRHVNIINLDSYDLEFSNCDCVPGSGVVQKEFCKDDCKTMSYIFFLTVISGAFIAGTGVVPGMLILLRSVPPQLRSPGLGLQGFLVSLLGTLPSPILWGAIIDSSCLVWDKVCSEHGACQIYDPLKLRVRMHLIYVGIRVISIISDLYVFYHAKGLNIQDDENEKKLEKKVSEAVGVENITLDVL